MDDRHIVTCAHVAIEAGIGLDEDGAPRGTLAVELVDQASWRGIAVVSEGGWFPEQPDGSGDVAVLEVADRSLPLPAGAVAAPLCLARTFSGHSFETFGFPSGGVEYDAGVPVEGVLGQPGGPGWVQVQAAGTTGRWIEGGFSGAAVWDRSENGVVGMIVTKDRSPTDRVAFMLPVSMIATLWPQLEHLILTPLMRDADLVEHWGPRARGIRLETRQGGWLFTGRTSALTTLSEWLNTRDRSDRLRVVTGGPGSGKSAVVARLVTTADRHYRPGIPLAADSPVPEVDTIDVAVRAKGRTVAEIVARLAEGALLGASTTAELIDALNERGYPLTIVVDALDEAVDPAAVGELLVSLRETSTRLLVGTRRDQLARLQPKPDQIVDLDDRAYLDEQDIANYVRQCLLLEHNPNAPTPYRGRAELAGEVARAVAARATPTFLVARLTADGLVADASPVDTTGPGWQLQFPGTVADAMDDYLTRFGDQQATIRDFLRPLAYAPGPLPADQLWVDLATALTYGKHHYYLPDLDDVVDVAVDYLVESAQGGYRLFHQALADALQVPARAAGDHQAIHDTLLAAVPVQQDGERDWDHAHPYVRAHLAHHAARAGELDPLIEDPRFVAAADPDRLDQELDAVRQAPARLIATAFRLALNSLRRSTNRYGQLQLALRQAGANDIANHLTDPASGSGWHVPWAQLERPSPHRILAGHTDWVTAVAVTALDGIPVAVTTSYDKTVRMWDLTTGVERATLTGHTDSVEAVAVTAVDGVPIAVSTSGDGTARVWDLNTGAERFTLAGHRDRVLAVGVAAVDGVPVAVTTSEDGTARVWDLDTGVERHILAGHTARVDAVAVTAVDGVPVAVTTSDDDTVRVWDLNTGAERHTLAGHTDHVRAVAVAALDGVPVAVTASSDGTARVWDLNTGIERHTLRGHIGRVDAVAVTALDGLPVAVTGGADNTARVWDLNTGIERNVLRGHTSAPDVVTVMVFDELPLAVTAGWDRTVRVWDVSTGIERHTLSGHTGWVRAVAVTAVGKIPVVVTASADGTARVWELTSGSERHALAGHTNRVRAVAVAEVGGISVGVTAGWDRTRVWELRTGAERHVLGRRAADAVAVTAVDGVPVAITANSDGLRVWDLVTGKKRHVLRGHTRGIVAVAVTAVDADPIAVTAGEDKTARVWDLRTGVQRHVLRGHTGWSARIKGVAVTAVDGVPFAVTAGWDRTLVWDLSTGIERHVLGHTGDWAVAVTTVDGVPVAVTSGWDGTARVWDLRTGLERDTLAGHTARVDAVAVTTVDGMPVAVTTSWDRTARVWDLNTGVERHILAGHTARVDAVAVTTLDGIPVAVTTSQDRTARVWDLAAGHERCSIELNGQALCVAAAAPHLILGCEDGIIVLTI